jgi:hypothetical protein
VEIVEKWSRMLHVRAEPGSAASTCRSSAARGQLRRSRRGRGYSGGDLNRHRGVVYDRTVQDKEPLRSPQDAGNSEDPRRKWVRRNPIPGHWTDVHAWITPEGRREEQAVCECGWKGPIRTEFEDGNRDGEDHLIEFQQRLT